MTDPDGIDRVVVSGPGAGATFTPDGATRLEQVIELDYDAPGEPVYQVAVTDARGENENATFTVQVNARANQGPTLTVETLPGYSVNDDYRLRVAGSSGIPEVSLKELLVGWGPGLI